MYIYTYIMFQDDFLNQVDQNDYDEPDANEIFENVKRIDKGYNLIYRKAFKKDGRPYNKKIEIYTSSGTGKHIRDAETGQYLNYKVGSYDEDLFFKVSLAMGECKSANGFSTLFYTSPKHYENHLQTKVTPILTETWEKKREARLIQIRIANNKKVSPVEVR